eukprot:13044-Heterococcus_DN1.PRE.2
MLNVSIGRCPVAAEAIYLPQTAEPPVPTHSAASGATARTTTGSNMLQLLLVCTLNRDIQSN